MLGEPRSDRRARRRAPRRCGSAASGCRRSRRRACASRRDAAGRRRCRTGPPPRSPPRRAAGRRPRGAAPSPRRSRPSSRSRAAAIVLRSGGKSRGRPSARSWWICSGSGSPASRWMPEVADAERRRCAGGRREQDLPAVARRPDPRCTVDVDSRVAVLGEERRARRGCPCGPGRRARRATARRSAPAGASTAAATAASSDSNAAKTSSPCASIDGAAGCRPRRLAQDPPDVVSGSSRSRRPSRGRGGSTPRCRRAGTRPSRRRAAHRSESSESAVGASGRRSSGISATIRRAPPAPGSRCASEPSSAATRSRRPRSPVPGVGIGAAARRRRRRSTVTRVTRRPRP